MTQVAPEAAMWHLVLLRFCLEKPIIQRCQLRWILTRPAKGTLQWIQEAVISNILEEQGAAETETNKISNNKSIEILKLVPLSPEISGLVQFGLLGWSNRELQPVRVLLSICKLSESLAVGLQCLAANTHWYSNGTPCNLVNQWWC